MASRTELGRRMDELVRELAEEFGEPPESDESLMARIENWAIEIGDAVMARAVERRFQSRLATGGEECCPACGRSGYCKGNRERVLQTRRGEVRLEEAEYYCSRCRKSFFPVSQRLGIEPDSRFTPGALQKVVHAGVHAGSFRQAEADLHALAELSVSSQRVRRATVRIGHERVAQRDERVEAFMKLPLPAQRRDPTGQAPPVACVEMDGGRVQIRRRVAPVLEPVGRSPGRLRPEVRPRGMGLCKPELSQISGCFLVVQRRRGSL